MKRALTTLLAASSITLISGATIADGGSYGGHQMMWGNWVMGPMMMLVMVVIVVVAVILILKAFGLGGQANAKQDNQDKARAILNERFAKGEIEKNEYEDRKKALGG